MLCPGTGGQSETIDSLRLITRLSDGRLKPEFKPGVSAVLALRSDSEPPGDLHLPDCVTHQLLLLPVWIYEDVAAVPTGSSGAWGLVLFVESCTCISFGVAWRGSWYIARAAMMWDVWCPGACAGCVASVRPRVYEL